MVATKLIRFIQYLRLNSQILAPAMMINQEMHATLIVVVLWSVTKNCMALCPLLPAACQISRMCLHTFLPFTNGFKQLQEI